MKGLGAREMVGAAAESDAGGGTDVFSRCNRRGALSFPPEAYNEDIHWGGKKTPEKLKATNSLPARRPCKDQRPRASKVRAE